jgi:acyl-CoA synthetase (AMP-forming)/AMP-acid ligase II
MLVDRQHPGTMLDGMLRGVERSPEKGIRFYRSPEDNEFLTYRQLDSYAKHDAVQLRRAGLRPMDRVVLAYSPSIDFVRAVYACFYAGLVVVPVPLITVRQTEFSRSRLLQIYEDAEAGLILSTPEAVAQLGGHLPRTWTISEPNETELSADWVHPGTASYDLAVLQYTSGSTGSPKGVVVTHRNLVENERAIQQAIGYDTDSIMCGWLPHYHDMGLIGQYLQPIYTGFDLVATAPSQFLRRPVIWLQLITTYRATTTVAPDFAYDLCAKLVTDQQLKALDLSSLTSVVTGAEPVRASTLERFSKRFAVAGFDSGAFKPAYGMAEATLLVTIKRTGDPVRPLLLDAQELEAGRAHPASDGSRSVTVVSCGPAAPAHEALVVDTETGSRLPDGVVGEVWVAGPSVSEGYWRNSTATHKTFEAVCGGRGHYLRTGDLGFSWDDEIVITGRLDDLINVRGRNIYPSDLENEVTQRVSSHGNVVAAAFGWEDQAVAMVVEAEPKADSRRIAAMVNKEIARDFALGSIGVAVVRRGVIPRTTSGKVRRSATRDLLVAGELPVLHSEGLRSVTNEPAS